MSMNVPTKTEVRGCVCVCVCALPPLVQNLISVFKTPAQELPDTVLSDYPSDECLGIPPVR